MRTGLTFTAAILSAFVFITAWSISFLPRPRDVVAAMQAPSSSNEALPKWLRPVWK